MLQVIHEGYHRQIRPVDLIARPAPDPIRDAMTRRYFAPDLPAAGGLIPLDETEARHANQVMRVTPGDRVTLFDGRGHESPATVVKTGRRECVCEAEPASEVDRESPFRLTIATALPKPDRAKEMVERLSELGVDELVPLTTERTQRPPSASQIAKLRRGVIESCKQSGRNRLMSISDPVTFDESLQRTVAPTEPVSRMRPNSHARLGSEAAPPRRWILTPDASPTAGEWAGDRGDDLGGLGLPGGDGVRAVAWIGPEGGWSPSELEQAFAAGLTPIGLGPRVYRIETAAAAIAAIVSFAAAIPFATDVVRKDS